MKRIIPSLLFSAVCFSSLLAAPGELSTKMEKAARQYGKVYTQKPELAKPATVAVFPFQCEKKLAEKKYGLAAAEIFTHQLHETGNFKIVERSELARILDEQKLSMTGLIASEKAVQVGQMLGAKLLVVGSIARMGDTYQISIRLIHAETSEVLLTDLVELARETFDKETTPYIPYVPERQVIGLYLGYGQFLAEVVDIPLFSKVTMQDVTYLDGQFDVVYNNPESDDEPDINNLGLALGAKYSPFKWLMVDLSYVPFYIKGEGIQAIANLNSDTMGVTISTTGNDFNLSLKGFSVVTSVQGVYEFKKNFRCFAGYGVTVSPISYEVSGKFKMFADWGSPADHRLVQVKTRLEDADGDALDKDGKDDFYDRDWNTVSSLYNAGNLDQSSVLVTTYSFGNTGIGHLLRLGLEWQPQERFGISLFGNIGIVPPKKVTYYYRTAAWGITDSSPADSTLFDEQKVFMETQIKAESNVQLTGTLYF